MKIEVRVTTNAKKNKVEEENGAFKVSLTALAVDGKANKALLKLLAQHFGVRPYQLEIIKGLKSRHKTISIDGLKSWQSS